MDNKKISIQHVTRAAFDLAFNLFFVSTYSETDRDYQKATHYIDHADKGLILLWSEDTYNKSIPLLTPLGWKEASNLAWTWLKNQSRDKYPPYPDMDGSVNEGYKVYNEDWGHVVSHYAILAVKPSWALYGK